MSDWIWQPDAEAIERTNIWRFMRRLGFDNLNDFLRYSHENTESFWDELMREIGVDWFAPYDQVLDASRGVEWCTWFRNGKLNIAANTLDRHVARTNPAIVAETEDGATRMLTFAELARETDRIANGLRALGLAPGDRVALVMPMVPEIVAILYACFKLGLIAVPIFAGFGAGAIRPRLEDSGARVVFTSEHLTRRGKRIPLAEKLPANITTIDLDRVTWDDITPVASLPLDSEASALLLYTSGTTGKPKGVLHTHAGALAQLAKEIYLGFDHQPEDRFFWLTDIGWIMGAWTIIGNHHFGGTIFLYDGAPDYPAADRLWEMLERHRITTFGVSPTAVRLLMRTSDAERFRFPDLRILGSTGEPWDDTSYRWFFEHIGRGRCPIINISGGTEILGSFLFPLPIQPLKPCTIGQPAPGMAVECVDEEGVPVRGRTGYLVCTKPAPSMTRGVWGAPERYIETYWSRFPGWWFHGDWASVDADGHWFIHGRADESMNVAGRKVGPAEVEEALISHPAVSEAAVIGVPDEIKGEAIVAFAVLKAPVEESELIRHVADVLGPTLRPKQVRFVGELPKTQSGKIVRRLIRQKFLGEELTELSTVSNPGALESFS